MPETSALHAAIARFVGHDATIADVVSCSGGCIHVVRRVTLADGRRYCVKLAGAARINLFTEESAGLAALRETGTVMTPAVIGVGVFGGNAALVLEWLEPAGSVHARAWSAFGEQLATLHSVDASRFIPGCPRGYGFHHDNHLGPTPQCNTPCANWIDFVAEHRLGFQLALARRAGLLSADNARPVEELIANLANLLPQSPPPALLHGDLWSGNALPTMDRNGQPAIALIDPACSIGDGLADIAMMRLFGGFPESCFEAYAANAPAIASADLQRRLAIYQFYHALNHLNIFGDSYRPMVMQLCRTAMG